MVLNVTQNAGISLPESAMYTIQRRGRFWEVLDPAGVLVCLTVYKRGAREVVRRLSAESALSDNKS